MKQLMTISIALLILAAPLISIAADDNTTVCPKCKYLNAATNRYCIRCGAVLTASQATPQPAAQPATQSAEQPAILPPSRPTVLQVGMSRVFHLRDHNVVSGRLSELVGDSIAVIETSDGRLSIPVMDILDERVDIQKLDETRYAGPLISEDEYSVSVKTPYGVVVVMKKDIISMDRYYGDRKVNWQEEKKRFYSTEELIDVFLDPTATPLQQSKVYLSGLSLGYGFTENFTLRTQFGPNFTGDLNLQPHLRIYHKATGSSDLSLALGLRLFDRHAEEIETEQYSHWIVNKATQMRMDDEDERNRIPEVMDDSTNTRFFWSAYMVMSRRQSLASGRGKWGWHLGAATNSLAIEKPKLRGISGYEWDKNFTIPYRVWAAMDYDLTKNLKFLLEVFADNGHKFITFDQSWDSYTDFGGHPFTIQTQRGKYQPVDLDFGFLWNITETFRLGVHFQSPYATFYWKW